MDVRLPMAPDRYDVFISYARRDAAFAAQLRAQLQGAGKVCWLDSCDLAHGQAWWPAILDAIARSACVVCLVSPAYRASRHCASEAGHALMLHKTIIQVLWEGVAPPEALAHLNAIVHDGDAAATAGVIAAAIGRDAHYDRARRDLLAKALEWQDKGYRASLLPRAEDLREARLLVARCNADGLATPLERDYVAAAVALHKRRMASHAALMAVMVLQAGITAVSVNQPHAVQAALQRGR